MFNIDISDYRHRVMGCWLGKAIGGTLGMPYEGKLKSFNLSYYEPVPTRAMPNDDLDLQVLWLKMVERFGPHLGCLQLARGWSDHYDFPCDEYATTLANFDRGIQPPASGHVGNYCGDCMGSPIRSEIWAALAPGDPELACKLALEDAILDHDGEGIWGELFLAALESAGFVISDPEKLIELGLSAIPADCRLARSVRKTLQWFETDRDWRTVRERILAEFGRDNWTDAPLNLTFVILGWLAGRDFGEQICTAVNCGYDADCTGATLGAILGILNPDSIPEIWKKPISRDLVVLPEIKNLNCPKTIDELTDLTVKMAERMLYERSARVRLVQNAGSACCSFAVPVLTPLEVPDPRSILITDTGVRITVHYPQGLTFTPGQSLPLVLAFENMLAGSVSLNLDLLAPTRWKLNVRLPAGLDLKHGETKRIPLEVVSPADICNYSEYLLLGLEQSGVRAEYRLPLLAAWQWHFKSDREERTLWQPEQVLYPVQELNLLPGETFSASAWFHFPRLSEPVRLILAGSGAGSLTLDGVKVIDYDQPQFLPLFHRMAPGTSYDATLQAGWHRFEITLRPTGPAPRAVLLLARPHDLRPITDITVRADL